MKNITNGQIMLNYDIQDKVSQDYKLIRSPNYQSLQFLRHSDPKTPISYYIQNIRSGSFSQISQTYMKQSSQQKPLNQHFTVDSFQTEMHILLIQFQNKLFKITTFFQGLLTGMTLLYTITLNLSQNVSYELIRVEDQAIRVLSVISTLGALYSVFIASQKYEHGKMKSTSTEVDQLYKSFILCVIELVFYFIGYIIYNVSHMYAVSYNINGSNYSSLTALTTIFTVISLIGWLVTNTNTYKYENKN